MGGTEVITTGGTEVTVTGGTEVPTTVGAEVHTTVMAEVHTTVMAEVPTTVIGMTGMMMMIKGCASTESGGQTARALQTLAPTENSLR
jgi:hypothetical protein